MYVQLVTLTKEMYIQTQISKISKISRITNTSRVEPITLVVQRYLIQTTRIGCDIKPDNTLHKKATIRQVLVTTIFATSKSILFPGHNHLLTTGTDDLTL